MTTCRELPASNEMRTWAAEQIGVPAGASAEACRAAVLKALPDEDFVPGETLRSAAQIVTSGAATEGTRDLFLRDIEPLLRGRVDELAAQFFTLETRQRRQHYQDLQEQAAPLPALLARLRRLDKGMHVECEPSAGLRGDCAELCDNVCELFTLAPLASIARRQELEAQWSLAPERWRVAASELFELAPRVAKLQEPVLDRLRLGAKLREAQARRRAARVRVAPVPASGDSTANPGRYAWLIIVVVVALLKLLVSAGSRDSTPSYKPPPQVTLPKNFLDDWELKNGVWGPKEQIQDAPKDKDVKDRPRDAAERLQNLREALKKNRERMDALKITREKKRGPVEPVPPVGPRPERPEGRSP